MSTNWAEFQWDPVEDAVAYRIYRDERLLDTIAADEDGEFANSGEAEMQRYWDTASYIDCNFTRFLSCETQAPTPGESYEYTIRSVDADGLESAPSAVLPVTFEENRYADVDIIRSDMEIVFEDEFNDVGLDPSRWNTRLPWGPDTSINGELQYFVDTINEPDFGYSPFAFTGNALQIRGVETPDELLEAANGQPFLAGAITTRDSFNMTYGYVEARIRPASGSGKLTSFFLFHQWAALNAPEIDIIEFLGENTEFAYQTYHYRSEVDGTTFHSSPTMYAHQPGVDFDEDFHIFSVLWEPNLMVWFIDGQEVQRVSGPAVARQRSYITAYLVMGSNWTPRPDPADPDFSSPMEIDWIRAWQRPENIATD
ncbi:MAG: hypothetical protein CSB44_05880 [Gammaproteobacteria bacterium]|nr:MAG: hypothetical protein CSB44_05880 [Gammaproteobacteria bacterium]PIE36844.1 MAG: hypothetical protein CSA54_03025 [Gammaproteobacteria bacterium]